MNEKLVAETARAARYEEASTQKDAQIVMLKEHSSTWMNFAETNPRKGQKKDK